MLLCRGGNAISQFGEKVTMSRNRKKSKKLRELVSYFLLDFMINYEKSIIKI